MILPPLVFPGQTKGFMAAAQVAYPDKDEDLCFSNPVLALSHPDHRELGRALTV
jgi:hypothetical protein